ncbi:pilus assembly protein TadG-related protein [Massilia sp. SR12]
MRRPAAARRQRGGIATMFALALPLVAGMAGLALELAMAFQRQGQLQQAADMSALAAAQQLDGTAAGIDHAVQLATDLAFNRPVRGLGRIVFNPAALRFASAPGGPWLAYGAAVAAPLALHYARVDMGALDASYSSMPSLFGGLLGGATSTALAVHAVAGAQGVRVLPLAICAPSSVAQATRANGGGVDEIVQYGLRLGVGYNLLALNPAPGAASGEFFLVDPASPPGSPAVAASTDDASVAPFMCSGKLAYPALAGMLNLRRISAAGFGLWQQLNSRFGLAGAACSAYHAPPDTNVREYVGSGASWMNSVPPQAAASASTPAPGQPLQSVADGAPPLPPLAPAQYGTLWAYGPARTPAMAAINANKWGTLYPAAPPLAASGWPLGGPYAVASYGTAPLNGVGRKGRRLLHVPLLACPLAPGSQVQGSVLAVARFLLTARASASVLPAEFAGILAPAEIAALATDVELLQ